MQPWSIHKLQVCTLHWFENEMCGGSQRKWQCSVPSIFSVTTIYSNIYIYKLCAMFGMWALIYSAIFGSSCWSVAVTAISNCQNHNSISDSTFSVKQTNKWATATHTRGTPTRAIIINLDVVDITIRSVPLSFNHAIAHTKTHIKSTMSHDHHLWSCIL